MFNTLFALFQKGLALVHLSTISGHLNSILSLFENEYLVTKDAKNAAIDAVIAILEAHKDVVAPIVTAPVTIAPVVATDITPAVETEPVAVAV